MSTTANPTNATSTTNQHNGVNDRRLFYLYDLTDFKVHHDDTDIRGWDIKSSLGTKIGTVENLIVDKPAKKVRYLEVNFDSKFFHDYAKSGYYLDNKNENAATNESAIHFIVPIGLVSLDKDDKNVEISGLSLEAIGATPRYRRGSEVKPSYELETLGHYADHHKEYGSTFNRSRYRNFDDNLYSGIDDQFYTSGFFNSDRYYDRHQEAITSKGL